MIFETYKNATLRKIKNLAPYLTAEESESVCEGYINPPKSRSKIVSSIVVITIVLVTLYFIFLASSSLTDRLLVLCPMSFILLLFQNSHETNKLKKHLDNLNEITRPDETNKMANKSQ